MYPLVYAGDIMKPHVPRNQSGYMLYISLFFLLPNNSFLFSFFNFLCYYKFEVELYKWSLIRIKTHFRLIRIKKHILDYNFGLAIL